MQDDDRCLASEAVAFLSAHGVEHPARKILECLTTGELRASGYFTYEIQGERETSRWERELQEIPVRFWEIRRKLLGRLFAPEMGDDDDFEDDWQNSQFSNQESVVDKSEKRIKHFQSATDVSFAYAHLKRLTPAYEGSESTDEPVAKGAGEAETQNKGGKPASKHGDVIAEVTLRLVDLPEAQFERYTTDALAHELAEAYSRLGQAAPSERNRQNYAAGILRVLRARKTPV